MFFKISVNIKFLLIKKCLTSRHLLNANSIKAGALHMKIYLKSKNKKVK